jgi:hypothetical protein
MKLSIRITLPLLILFASACVSNFKVSADYDKQTDFMGYNTFSLLPWNSDVSTNISNEAKTKLYATARSEMEKRGYKYVEKGGELSVGISVLIEEKVEYRADGTVNYSVGYSTWGYGGVGMGYSSPTTIRSYYYNDGTIVVDVFDEKKKTLVWQGFGFDRLDDSAQKNIKKIPTYMKYIFYKYPLKPGKKK